MSPTLAGGLSTTELPGKSYPEAPSAPQHRTWHSINICTYFIVYTNFIYIYMGFPHSSVGKESACSAGDTDSIPGLENPLEEDMTTHSSILAWRIPWTEEPGGLQSMGP